MVAQKFGILQQDPQIPLRIRGESLHCTDGKRCRRGYWKSAKTETIEPKQSLGCSDPQITIRGLRESGDGSASEPFLAPQ